MPHFYCPPHNITSTDGKFILPPEESRHLIKVLRKKPGDTIDIFDGEGNSYQALIDEVEKKSDGTYVVKGTILTPRNESQSRQNLSIKEKLLFKINFYQSLPKKQKIEDIIDKLSQLGIASLTGVITSRTIVRISKDEEENRIKRWQRIAIASSKQSARKDVMHIGEKILRFEDALTECATRYPEFPILIAWEGELKNNLHSTISQLKSDTNRICQGLNVFIGPEGGYTIEEITLAQKKFSAITVGLGERILRVDTAAIMVAATLNYEFL